MSTVPASAPWHQSLVFALLGERHPGLGQQPAPDLAELDRWLHEDGRLAAVRERWTERRRTGLPSPFPLPDDLAVPPAQFTAALRVLRVRLGLVETAAPPAPHRPLTADDVRLVRDVPPHHGG